MTCVSMKTDGSEVKLRCLGMKANPKPDSDQEHETSHKHLLCHCAASHKIKYVQWSHEVWKAGVMHFLTKALQRFLWCLTSLGRHGVNGGLWESADQWLPLENSLVKPGACYNVCLPKTMNVKFWNLHKYPTRDIKSRVPPELGFLFCNTHLDLYRGHLLLLTCPYALCFKHRCMQV